MIAGFSKFAGFIGKITKSEKNPLYSILIGTIFDLILAIPQRKTAQLFKDTLCLCPRRHTKANWFRFYKHMPTDNNIPPF